MNDFEKQWLRKLRLGLQKIKKDDLFDRALITHTDDVAWTVHLMQLLKYNLKSDELCDAMCGCACLANKQDLKILQEDYKLNRDLTRVHEMLQDYFEIMIKKYKNLSDNEMKFVKENNMGMAGTLSGNTITAVKVPKEFHKYFESDDERLKPYFYCHCPRIRESLKSNEKQVDENYCYCGAGFYKDIWEFILQRSVEVEIIESILKGNQFCKIQIRL